MIACASRWMLPTVIVLAALVAYRAIVVKPRAEGVQLARNEPATIRPRFDDPRVVTDEQLSAVLARVRPPAGPPNTNQYVHALRLWGATADFKTPGVPSGVELSAYFLDDASFRRQAGESAPPLFLNGPNGIEVRSYDDRLTDRATSSHHTDDLLATFAESGVPLNAELHMRDGKAKVADLLRTSLKRFHLDQHEYEWTAIAYARYVMPERTWRNKFGENISVDALVDELISHAPDVGPCNGLHRLEALAVLNRANEELQTLSPRTRMKMLVYMKQAARALTAAQTSEGYWTREWPRGEAAAIVAEKKVSLHDKLLVTGHHLEWLALAPDEVQPPGEVVVRAAQWLARTLVEMDEAQLLEAYGPYTHAARGLCLWRGMEAWEAWQSQRAELATAVAQSE
jgi:hypothetical protein